MTKSYTRVARLRDAQTFRDHIQKLQIHLPFDEEIEIGPEAPLAQPYTLKDGFTIHNRFCILPMEGWDGTLDGHPSEKTERRWRNFGLSGAKLIWGGEAVAVRHDGRANTNQLMINDHTLAGLERLRETLIAAHKEQFGDTSGLLVGLQLTHSGRFARPNVKTRLEPKILYHHPLLDQIFDVDPGLPLLSDGEIETLIGEFVRAARQAYEIGFQFVDIKHCHGYLGHEFLSAVTRPGRYGGAFENRTRFLREIVAGIRRDVPGLRIGVRVSAFDFPPFRPDPDNIGQPLEYRDEQGRYPYAFGGDPERPLQINNDEPRQFLALLESLGIELVNLSAANPYYNPHLMRPA